MEAGDNLPEGEHEDDTLWVPMPGNDTPLPGEGDDLPYDYEINDDSDVDSLSEGELTFSDSEEEEADKDVKNPDAKIEWGDQVRLIHLRRFINELAENVQQKDYAVQKYREEVKKCKSQKETLESEKEQVLYAIQTAESEKNTSAQYRLKAQYERILAEIVNEDELLKKIKVSLEKAEYELAQAQVEQGKMILAEDELSKKEALLKEQQNSMAKKRAQKEKNYASKAVALRHQKHRSAQHAVQEGVRRQHMAVESAKRSQEKHNQYLQHTVAKMRQRQVEENVRQKEHMEKRMESMLALKNDIINNRENLRALQARDKALSQKKKDAEDQWMKEVEEAGGNATEEMLKKKRLQEFEAKKEAHRVRQDAGQVEIAAKLLAEEERIQKRRLQQPNLFTDPKKEKEKNVKPHPRPKLQTLEMASKSPSHEISFEIDMTKFEGKTGDESGDEGLDYTPLTISRETTALPESSKDGEGESLAKPEFEGMWDHHKPYNVPKDLPTGPALPGATKMEKAELYQLGTMLSEMPPHSAQAESLRGRASALREQVEAEMMPYLAAKNQLVREKLTKLRNKEIMTRVLEKQRDGITVKQVAGGKEFKGCAFYSKPAVIHFKDFEVGKTYKKKVTLTNVSYTVNYCKLTGLTEHLKDFITLLFDPPGQMSAGLTCDLMVTFKPMINEDLEGEVSFLAQTGPFSIPVRCTTKKCDLSVDKSVVDFGTSVIGETLYRSFTLTNKGALATKYDFYKITGMKQRTVTSSAASLGRLTTADTGVRGAESPDLEEGLKKGKTDTSKKKEAAVEKQDAETPEKQEDNEVGGTERDGSDVAEGEGTRGDGEEAMQVTADLSFSDDGMDIGQTDMDELYSLDGIKVGQVSEGEIGPFSSVKLDIVWQPTIPGKVDTEFLISFEDPNSESISIQCVANAIDVPVWVERQTVDLRICMLDRLYQDTIIVNNRATTALRLKFEVCKELQNHMELLPKTGYIQAQSQFSAQLKFLPRKSLFTEAGSYFDKDTGVLEAPMTITVADQTRPVHFTVHAVVTNSDLEFSVNSIDFGCSTIYESVKSSITLTNHSILPQQFGFVGIPDYVDVQPNDGFGTLLPLETIELDIIFSPKKARNYSFELTCKSLINREFKIRCCGVGVHPPLELSQQVLHFQATSLSDVSTIGVHVINSHTSMNEFTHPVPRIGKGDIAPVGPTSFEFMLPPDAPISVSPSVGTVEPGGRCHVYVRFNPQLSDSDIRKEAVRMLTRTLEARAQEEYKAELQREKEKQEEAAKKKPPGKGKGSAKGRSTGRRSSDANQGVALKGPAPIQVPDEDTIDIDSSEYAAAKTSLMRQFKGRFQSFKIPCYVASGACANPGELPYSEHNTLYLEVHCPAVRPQLVVISDNGRTNTDFGEVSIGQQVIKSITVQNITKKHIDLSSTILDPAGPFQILNSLRMLAPEASHMILVCFTPHKGQKFQEPLEIQCPNSCLHLTLRGQGVNPMVTLSVKENVMDLGAIISNEYREETFKIENTSTLSVHYCIKLDSQSLLRHFKSQGIPPFIQPNAKYKSLVGTQNNNGQQVFDCIPAEGVIPAGGSKEITVTFAPDHASDYYSDGCRIELFGEEESHVFTLLGVAKDHIMYLKGGDALVPEVESLAVLPPRETEEDARPPAIPLLVTMKSVAMDTEFSTSTCDIYVGCVRTMAVSQKKNGEWFFDNLAPINALGFNIDPVKGMIEAGTKRPITITWKPPTSGYDPSTPMEASIQCTVKGDVTEVYRLILRGFIVSG